MTPKGASTHRLRMAALLGVQAVLSTLWIFTFIGALECFLSILPSKLCPISVPDVNIAGYTIIIYRLLGVYRQASIPLISTNISCHQYHHRTSLQSNPMEEVRKKSKIG